MYKLFIQGMFTQSCIDKTQISYHTSSSQNIPTMPQEGVVSRCTSIHSTTISAVDLEVMVLYIILVYTVVNSARSISNGFEP